MENETTSPNEKTWFADLNWKTAVMTAVLAFVVGGGSGAGVVATKAVAAQGITQDQADVRYLTKEETRILKAERDSKIEEIKRDMVTEKVFDERTNMILRQIELMRVERQQDREYFERILLNQNR